jgi:hypothetical protein
LLLQLFEANELRFTHEAMVNYHGVCGRQLIDAELLLPSGFDTAVTNDEDGLAYEVGHDPRRDALGYHHPIEGWISVTQDRLQLYAPDLAAIFSLLLGSELRQLPNGPTSLEGTTVWHLGSLRLLRSSRTPTWFARRLGDRSSQDRLAATVQRYPASERLVLTSTPHDRLPAGLVVPGATIVSIADLVDPNESWCIDMQLLRARYCGTPVPPVGEPLWLSPDGRTLTILGTQIVFLGESQRRAIRILVDAYRAGRGVNAAATLQKAGFETSVRTFRQAFRKQWTLLTSFLRSRGGLWRFEL